VRRQQERRRRRRVHVLGARQRQLERRAVALEPRRGVLGGAGAPLGQERGGGPR